MELNAYFCEGVLLLKLGEPAARTGVEGCDSPRRNGGKKLRLAPGDDGLDGGLPRCIGSILQIGFLAFVQILMQSHSLFARVS